MTEPFSWPTERLVLIQSDGDEFAYDTVGRYHTPADAQIALDGMRDLGMELHAWITDTRPVVTVEDCRPIYTCKHTDHLALADAIMRADYLPGIRNMLTESKDVFRFLGPNVKISRETIESSR